MAHPVLYIDAEKESQGAWLFFLGCQSPLSLHLCTIPSFYFQQKYVLLLFRLWGPKFPEFLVVAVYSNE